MLTHRGLPFDMKRRDLLAAAGAVAVLGLFAFFASRRTAGTLSPERLAYDEVVDYLTKGKTLRWADTVTAFDDPRTLVMRSKDGMQLTIVLVMRSSHPAMRQNTAAAPNGEITVTTEFVKVKKSPLAPYTWDMRHTAYTPPSPPLTRPTALE